MQTSSHEYEQRLHRASQNELQYQDQIENERMAMQAAVADLEQSVRDCQAQVDFERSQFAEREVELDRIHQERLAGMRAESDAAKSQLVEVTERLDARVHFEKTGRTQMEASLSNQSIMVAALQGQLAQSLSSFSALQEENKQLVLQVEYYASNLKKLHVRKSKSQDLEDEESFGWDESCMVEVVEGAVSEAPTSHRASPTVPVPVSATPSASPVRVPGVAAVDRPAASQSQSPERPAHHQPASDDETDEADEVFELPPAAAQAAQASPCGSSAATAAESAFPSTSTATAGAVTRVEPGSPSTVPLLEGPASDAGAVTKGDLLEAPAPTSSPTKKTDTAVTGAVGDPTTGNKSEGQSGLEAHSPPELCLVPHPSIAARATALTAAFFAVGMVCSPRGPGASGAAAVGRSERHEHGCFRGLCGSGSPGTTRHIGHGRRFRAP